MKIELLYFSGCPCWKEGLNNLKSALDAEGSSASINLVEIKDNAQAEQEKFLGSPSFRVNGTDLWYEEREQYAMGCRLYMTSKGYKGSPTVEMLREKIQSAAAP